MISSTLQHRRRQLTANDRLEAACLTKIQPWRHRHIQRLSRRQDFSIAGGWGGGFQDEAVCRHCLRILTAATIKIWKCGINWYPDSWQRRLLHSGEGELSDVWCGRGLNPSGPCLLSPLSSRLCVWVIIWWSGDGSVLIIVIVCVNWPVVVQ